MRVKKLVLLFSAFFIGARCAEFDKTQIEGNISNIDDTLSM